MFNIFGFTTRDGRRRTIIHGYKFSMAGFLIVFWWNLNSICRPKPNNSLRPLLSELACDSDFVMSFVVFVVGADTVDTRVMLDLVGEVSCNRRAKIGLMVNSYYSSRKYWWSAFSMLHLQVDL